MKLTTVRSLEAQSSPIVLKSERDRTSQLSIRWHVINGKLVCCWLVD